MMRKSVKYQKKITLQYAQYLLLIHSLQFVIQIHVRIHNNQFV
jgi:hypothetical protein